MTVAAAVFVATRSALVLTAVVAVPVLTFGPGSFVRLVAFALSAVPGLIAGIFYAMLRVTRDTYETTRQALAARNATQASP